MNAPPKDQSETPTQPAMAAVRPPPSIEERVTTIEGRLGIVESHLTEVEGRVDSLGLKVDDNTKKHDALESKVDALASDVTDVKDETKKQTATLERIEQILAPLAKQLSGLLNNPRVRLVVYLLSVALTGWLASKGFKLP